MCLEGTGARLPPTLLLFFFPFHKDRESVGEGLSRGQEVVQMLLPGVPIFHTILAHPLSVGGLFSKCNIIIFT